MQDVLAGLHHMGVELLNKGWWLRLRRRPSYAFWKERNLRDLQKAD